jgi:hypothetical protein
MNTATETTQKRDTDKNMYIFLVNLICVNPKYGVLTDLLHWIVSFPQALSNTWQEQEWQNAAFGIVQRCWQCACISVYVCILSARMHVCASQLYLYTHMLFFICNSWIWMVHKYMCWGTQKHEQMQKRTCMKGMHIGSYLLSCEPSSCLRMCAIMLQTSVQTQANMKKNTYPFPMYVCMMHKYIDKNWSVLTHINIRLKMERLGLKMGIYTNVGIWIHAYRCVYVPQCVCVYIHVHVLPMKRCISNSEACKLARTRIAVWGALDNFFQNSLLLQRFVEKLYVHMCCVYIWLGDFACGRGFCMYNIFILRKYAYAYHMRKCEISRLREYLNGGKILSTYANAYNTGTSAISRLRAYIPEWRHMLPTRLQTRARTFESSLQQQLSSSVQHRSNHCCSNTQTLLMHAKNPNIGTKCCTKVQGTSTSTSLQSVS